MESDSYLSILDFRQGKGYNSNHTPFVCYCQLPSYQSNILVFKSHSNKISVIISFFSCFFFLIFIFLI